MRPDHALKSISHETTFDADTADLDTLRSKVRSMIVAAREDLRNEFELAATR